MDHNDLSKETKLSQAIELALTSGMYNERGSFMCHALQELNLHQHIPDVHQLVKSIYPIAANGYPLACALHGAGIIDIEKMPCLDQDEYTTQLYCWWVFDLKRKGL